MRRSIENILLARVGRHAYLVVSLFLPYCLLPQPILPFLEHVPDKSGGT